MKKTSIRIVSALLIILMTVPLFVSAVSNTEKADELKALGLFKGTDRGYELDRKPTRAEAAVMLVRFLGKEAEALTLKWTAPFTDVPDWAKPYVQYLYTAGLTVGYSDTTYAPGDDCSAQMYATFMLRALGYRDIDTGKNEHDEEKTDEKKTLIPEDTYICSMQLNSYYENLGVPANLSSVVDAWPSHDKGFDRGLTFMMSEEDIGYFDECVKASGKGNIWHVLNDGYEVRMADPEKCYIYSGKPGDADFGAKVSGTVKDVFGGCICSAADSIGPYIWIGNLWASSNDKILADGFYTFVLYNGDGSAVAFTEYVVTSFNEAAGYGYTQRGSGSSGSGFVPDFTYSDAVGFGERKGLINGANCDTKNFLRDHMVGISHTALTLPTADGKYSALIYRLADDGAVSRAAADAFMSLHEIASGGAEVNDAYLKRYADYASAEQWKKENIDNVSYPPVSFTVDGKSSDSISWKKSVGKKTVVTDYPNDEPVKRTYYKINYKSEDYGLNVELTVTEYEEYPVVEYEAYIINEAQSNSSLIRNVHAVDSRIYSGSGSVTLHAWHGCDYELTEYDPIDVKLGTGGVSSRTFSVTNGKATSTYLPNFNIEDKSNDRGTIAVLSWEGSWSSEFRSENSGIRWTAGQYSTSFCLRKGESFRVPLTVLLFYRGDEFNGQNIWRRWFYRHNVLRAQGERMTLNMLTCVGSSTGYPNASDDLEAVELLNRNTMNKIVRSFAQDAGWYECSGGNWYNVGNWYPDPIRYPKGLRPVIDAVHAAGMKYTLWLEPERAQPGTKTFGVLGDKLICLDKSGSLISSRNAASGSDGMVNFALPEAVDYMISLVDGIITENNIDCYRQDCNFCVGEKYRTTTCRFMSEYWSAYDSKQTANYRIPRTGMTENAYCTGLLRFWDELVKRHPTLTIDCCASGGQRYTLACARYSFMHTRTDWVTATPDVNRLDPTVNAQCDSYTLGLWYQLTGSGSSLFSTYDLRSRTVTSFGIGANVVGANLFSQARTLYYEMKSEIPYVIRGDFYPLTEYSTENRGYTVFQYSDPTDGSIRVYFFFRSAGKATVMLRDLAESGEYTYYTLGDDGNKTTVSAKKLAGTGLTVNGREKTAPVIIIQKKK